jgi:hypothetical protein
MAELNRPPNLLQPYRKGLDWNPARASELAAALDRGNTGIAPPVAILPRLELFKRFDDAFPLIEMAPGVGSPYVTPQLWWGDGSHTTYNHSTYTWPDGSTGHALPKDATANFGFNGNSFFQWGINLFPYWSVGNGGPGSGITLVVSSNIDLLDASSNLLTRATYNITDSLDSSYNYTTNASVSYGTEKINSFNAIRASASISGYSPFQISADLYYFLQGASQV